MTQTLIQTRDFLTEKLLAGVVGEVTAPTGFVAANAGAVTVKGILDLALGLIVVLAVAYIILSGYRYIIANGDPGVVKQAQSGITNTIIGLIIAFAAYFGVVLITGALNIPITDPFG